MFAQETCGLIGTEPVPTIMSYQEDDPFTITFAFHTASGMVEWNFARDLLTDLMNLGGSGLGDITFVEKGLDIQMTLHGRDAEFPVNILFPVNDVRLFLEQTERLVPSGTESSHIDFDAEWAEWRDGHAV